MSEHTMSIRVPDDERRRRLLASPQVYNKVMELAAQLEKRAPSLLSVMVDFKVGSLFRDAETGTVFCYEAVCTPLKHGDLVTLIAEAAHMQMESFDAITYFLIREQAPKPVILTEADEDLVRNPMTIAPLKLVNARDFIKYFAMGKWVMLSTPEKVDPDTFAGEHNVLRPHS